MTTWSFEFSTNILVKNVLFAAKITREIFRSLQYFQIYMHQIVILGIL